MKTIIENGMEWLWNHKPDIAIVGVLLAIAVWVTSTVSDFQHRLAATEHLSNNISNRQLPEITEAIREIKSDVREIKTDIVEIKEDIVEIKLYMKKIDTYLATKDKDYPRP